MYRPQDDPTLAPYVTRRYSSQHGYDIVSLIEMSLKQFYIFASNCEAILIEIILVVRVF
jgi:hypothetical protein